MIGDSDNDSAFDPSYQVDLVGTKAFDTVYQNTTMQVCKMIIVMDLSCGAAAGSGQGRVQVSPDNASWVDFRDCKVTGATNAVVRYTIELRIRPGDYMKIAKTITGTGAGTLINWFESPRLDGN